MASLRGARVDDDGIWMQAADGRQVTITRADLRAQFLAATGSRSAKRAAVMTWLKTTIVAALGSEQIDASQITFDFDDQHATRPGRPTRLETTNS